jgi:RNA polymerase sigma factor (sigma-70 family)
MAGGRIQHLIHFLRRAVGPGGGPATPDAQLLERFAAARDEAAFELLAGRHGPMVLGVCRRVLGDAHEAEDACQATFLVLARKAASAARHPSAGGWLHTVAYRVALRARARRATRAARERPLDEPPPTAAQGPADEAAWREVRRVIDEEVSRLPEKYRVPFVLYHLEGRSGAEVAQELGCPVGTVESWLTRARERLRAGLTRRGLAPAAALPAALAPPPDWLPQVTAAARAALAASQGTVGAVSAQATAWAGEVTRAFAAARVRVVVAVLVLAAVVVAVGGLAVGLLPRPEPPPPPEVPGAAPEAEARPVAPAVAVEPVKLTSFRAYPDVLNAVALSPDGKILAAAGGIGPGVILWDLEARKERVRLRPAHKFPALNVNCAAFSPDGQTLATGDNKKFISLWDVATGKEKAVARGHTVWLYAVAFSPDGKTLASAGGMDSLAEVRVQSFNDIPKESFEWGEVMVWDLTTGKARRFYQGKVGRVMSVAFSPDGQTLASAERDGAIRLWDVATGQEQACLRASNRPVHAVAFSPDGKTLAAAHEEKEDGVRLWDLATRRVRLQLRGNPVLARDVAFRPDGTLATAGIVVGKDIRQWQTFPGEVRLWDAATGQPRGAPLTCPHHANSLAFGDRGRLLAVGGARDKLGEVTVWDLNPPRPPGP